jgi:hypothetical protein
MNSEHERKEKSNVVVDDNNDNNDNNEMRELSNTKKNEDEYPTQRQTIKRKRDEEASNLQTDPQFQEFLSVTKKKPKFWANDETIIISKSSSQQNERILEMKKVFIHILICSQSQLLTFILISYPHSHFFSEIHFDFISYISILCFVFCVNMLIGRECNSDCESSTKQTSGW